MCATNRVIISLVLSLEHPSGHAGEDRGELECHRIGGGGSGLLLLLPVCSASCLALSVQAVMPARTGEGLWKVERCIGILTFWKAEEVDRA